MAVARNKVIDRWRREERRRARAHLVWSRERDEVDPFPDHWSRDATRRTVLDVLDRLPGRYRSLLVAHYVDEMTVPDIADATGGSVRSIESALARARRAFRDEFRRQEASA
jgi:RNA polymerase sigma-70 factor (ECF subfamily)